MDEYEDEYDYDHLGDFNYHMHTNELTDWFEDESDNDNNDNDGLDPI